MTDAVTAGCFSDFKLVKTRKVAQFVIELPLERADEALELLGGLPRPDREVWVAIAQLKSDPFTNPAPPATEPEPQAAPEEPKERRRITDMTFAARAAMLCQEKDAKGRNLAAAFFAERSPRDWNMATGATEEARADHCLKLILGITSKRQIDTNADLATDFDRISRRFHAWRQEPVA